MACDAEEAPAFAKPPSKRPIGSVDVEEAPAKKLKKDSVEDGRDIPQDSHLSDSVHFTAPNSTDGTFNGESTDVSQDVVGNSDTQNASELPSTQELLNSTLSVSLELSSVASVDGQSHEDTDILSTSEDDATSVMGLSLDEECRLLASPLKRGDNDPTLELSERTEICSTSARDMISRSESESERVMNGNTADQKREGKTVLSRSILDSVKRTVAEKTIVKDDAERPPSNQVRLSDDVHSLRDIESEESFELTVSDADDFQPDGAPPKISLLYESDESFKGFGEEDENTKQEVYPGVEGNQEIVSSFGQISGTKRQRDVDDDERVVPGVAISDTLDEMATDAAKETCSVNDEEVVGDVKESVVASHGRRVSIIDVTISDDEPEFMEAVTDVNTDEKKCIVSRFGKDDVQGESVPEKGSEIATIESKMEHDDQSCELTAEEEHKNIDIASNHVPESTGAGDVSELPLATCLPDEPEAPRPTDQLLAEEQSLDGNSERLLDEIASSARVLLGPSPTSAVETVEGSTRAPSPSEAMEVEEASKVASCIAGTSGSKDVPLLPKEEQKDGEEDSKMVLQSVKKLSRKELEVMVLRKIAQSMADRSEVKTLINQVKQKSLELQNSERKYQAMYKQMSDLAVVFKRYVNERKNNPNPAAPTRITRAVGLQVRLECPPSPTKPPTPLPVSAQPPSRKRGPRPKKALELPPVKPDTPPEAWTIPHPPSPRSPRKPVSRSPLRPPVSPARSPVRAPPSPSTPTPIQKPTNPASRVPPRTVEATSTAPRPSQPQRNPVGSTASSAPMVSIPSGLMGKASSTATSRLEPEPPRQPPPSSHSAVRANSQQMQMPQTPKVAKVTLPSNVTQMMAAQQMAAAAQAANDKQVKPSSGDVIDLTDEDDVAGSSLSVVQRSTSFNRSATTVAVRRSLSESTSSSQGPPAQSRTNRNQHPAPLPPTPANPRVALHLVPPPKPKVTLLRKGNGISVTWNMDLLPQNADIKLYNIYVYQETNSPPSTSMWKFIGAINALPLPMACTLKQFALGHRYYFAVQAKDKFDRSGVFSDIVSIVL